MSPHRRTLVPVLLLGGLLAAVLTACGDDEQPADTTAPAEEVVLLTYDSFALPEDAAAEFERQTGATIEVRATGDSGTLLTGALLSAGAPEGDVIFGIDNTLATRALSEDMLEPFTPESIDSVPDRYVLDGEAGERLTPIDSGEVCVNIDRNWFAEQGKEPPATLEDLADPAYRDLLVVESPVTSSPGLAFLLGTIDRYGEDGWQGYWQRLADNGVRVRPSWDDAYYSDYTVSGGDRPLVLSYASSPPVEVVFGEMDEPASSVLIDSCADQVEYAGVLRGAANPELARRLVEFMLSEEWQSELPLSNFVFPVVDVELPEEFRRFAQRADDPAGLPPERIDEGRDGWIEQWRDLME
jgi:thiamine transport system substrate-binding protein